MFKLKSLIEKQHSMGTFSKSYRTYVSLDKKCFSSIQALYVSIRFSLLTKPNPSHTHIKMSTYIPSKVESTWEKTDPNTETEKCTYSLS